MKHSNNSKGGFTLIELLVVIAIIGILASLVLPGVANAKFRANMLKCSRNLTSLYAGLLQYEMSMGGYPRGDTYKGAGFWNVLRQMPTPETSALGTKNHDKFVCPLVGDAPGDGVCNYRGPNFTITAATDESRPIGADRTTNHDPENSQKDINVLYFGGQVIAVKASSADWTDADSRLQD
ncbi:MAG: type II secretion system protein [Candidatus Brocadiia bacterium]